MAVERDREEEQQGRSVLRRRAVKDGGSIPVPPSVREVLRSPGQPLDAETRAFMEPRFGRDFSRVRVHTGAKAAESARAVNAHAYTVGENVVFGERQFRPTARPGQRLLAHELAHVMQQRKNQTAVRPSALAIGKPDDATEREADRIADRVMGSSVVANLQTIRRKPGGSAVLQRTIGDGHDLQSPRFAGDLVLEACFDDERLLRSGSRGPAVAKIQQALVDAGFPLPVFGVDGIFESETAGAVRDYQRTHGLDPDGIVGPLTMGSLDALFAGPTPPAPPGPAPPGPGPAPPETITSQTVATSPGARTRTTIGVGEEVNLTHSPGSAAWTTTGGTLSAATGVTVILTAPDTAQSITVRAGAATLAFDVIAPTGVHMDRRSGSNVKHHLNRADSGILTDVFLLPDTVNFLNVRYRELDVGAVVTTPGPYSCFSGHDHCGAGGGGRPCPDKALTSTVVAGKGTKSVLGDCAYSGHCGGTPPFVPGRITFTIPYEYKVGTGSFRRFATVSQVHTLAADGSTLTSDKAGAHGDTTVAAATSLIPQCP